HVLGEVLDRLRVPERVGVRRVGRGGSAPTLPSGGEGAVRAGRSGPLPPPSVEPTVNARVPRKGRVVGSAPSRGEPYTPARGERAKAGDARQRQLPERAAT